MQKIYYNGNIITNNENHETLSSMLINEGSVVFVGEKDEVLNLKNEETKLIDLKGNYVYPTLFAMKVNVFKTIDDKIKNANKGKNFQISADINENYDNFANFDNYKKEYLKLEKKYIEQGIATISEFDIDKKEFAFWKKMSEEKSLKLDVVAYVDLFDSKQVMDDNCVTYRKYKNHFRLGGYYLKVDGKIQELKAWLTKPYSGTKSHCGIGNIYGEQLYFLLKTALEEKKQIIFETHGDKSMQEVLTVLEELESKDNITNFYRPVFYSSGFIPEKFYSKLKHFDAMLLIENLDSDNQKIIKKFLGLFRKACFYRFDKLIKNDIRFILRNDEFLDNYLNNTINMYKNQKRIFNLKMLKNDKNNQNYTNLIQKIIYNNSAFICFDTDTKGGIENQKQSKFFICDKNIFDDKFLIKKTELIEE